MGKALWRDLKLASFKHWDVYLSKHQDPHIGTCYAQYTGDGAKFPENLPSDALLSFFRTVQSHCFCAIESLWAQDRSQIAFPRERRYQYEAYIMMVPRYTKPVTFAGEVFDERAFKSEKGVSYVPKGLELSSRDTLFAIRDALREELKYFPGVRAIVY